nr:hypothetical protein [uncultured Bacteroides sp.]
MGLANSDLRVGNIIIYNGKSCIVSDILSTKSIILYGIEDEIKTENINGLLIDENLLDNLGAIKIPDKGFVKYKIEIKTFLSIYFCFKDGKISNTYLYVAQDSYIGARYNQPFSYVHELQNLYFVLNREEMDINFCC